MAKTLSRISKKTRTKEILSAIVWRRKKAIQYGSNIDKAIQKLAKLKGFKYKKDYIMKLIKGRN